jgi:ABC-type Fe3+-hydroxamate transport system substrate-binding protein
MAIRIRDDMGRELTLFGRPRRIVSLVPSETDTLFALGAGDRVVGRTSYCEEPAERVAAIPTVGGTKDVDAEAVMALEPDLILANQEENARAPLERLADRRLPLFVSFPRRVGEAVAHVARLARLLGVEREPAAKALVGSGYRAWREAEVAAAGREPLAVFVPIWLDPLMTFNRDTYASDLLRLAGARNVFADRDRKYPLAADLALRSPVAADRAATRDIRYPRLRDEEIRERAPAAILLPDEPYAFTAADARRFAALAIDPPPRITHVSGRDLFWPGARTAGALTRLAAVLEKR